MLRTDRFTQYLTKNELNLAGQKLTLADVPEIALFLKKNPQIIKVNLSDNELNDQAVVDLSKRSPKIKSLNLSNNKITAVGAFAIAQHPKLIDLNLSNNRIEDNGAKAFVDNNKLISLTLNNCGIKGFSIAEFAKNKSLRHLDISRNGDEKRREKNDIAVLLEKNTQLTRLILNGYLLSQMDLVSISKHAKRVQFDKVVADNITDAVEANEWTKLDLPTEAWDKVQKQEIPESKPVVPTDKDWDLIKKRELSKPTNIFSQNPPVAEKSSILSWLSSFSFWNRGERKADNINHPIYPVENNLKN